MKTLKIDKNIHRDLKVIAIKLDITLQELIHKTLLARVLRDLKTEKIPELYKKMMEKK